MLNNKRPPPPSTFQQMCHDAELVTFMIKAKMLMKGVLVEPVLKPVSACKSQTRHLSL